MIFNVPGHIDMIRNGLASTTYPTVLLLFAEQVVKTETRRPNRGIYQVEAERKKPHYTGYAVQRKRGAPAEPDIRIVMDMIWKEDCIKEPISEADAWAEGGYTPEQYEKVFRELNPKWNSWVRWAFKFHVIEVQT